MILSRFAAGRILAVATVVLSIGLAEMRVAPGRPETFARSMSPMARCGP